MFRELAQSWENRVFVFELQTTNSHLPLIILSKREIAYISHILHDSILPEVYR